MAETSPEPHHPPGPRHPGPCSCSALSTGCYPKVPRNHRGALSSVQKSADTTSEKCRLLIPSSKSLAPTDGQTDGPGTDRPGAKSEPGSQVLPPTHAATGHQALGGKMLSHTVRGSRQVSGGPVGCENRPFLPVPPPPHEAPRHLQTRVECAALGSALRIKPSPPRPASAAPATEAGDRGELHKATKGRAPWLGTVQSARPRLMKAAGSRHNGSTCHCSSTQHTDFLALLSYINTKRELHPGGRSTAQLLAPSPGGKSYKHLTPQLLLEKCRLTAEAETYGKGHAGFCDPRPSARGWEARTVTALPWVASSGPSWSLWTPGGGHCPGKQTVAGAGRGRAFWKEPSTDSLRRSRQGAAQGTGTGEAAEDAPCAGRRSSSSSLCGSRCTRSGPPGHS